LPYPFLLPEFRGVEAGETSLDYRIRNRASELEELNCRFW
jgi:hypothetical protein